MTDKPAWTMPGLSRPGIWAAIFSVAMCGTAVLSGAGLLEEPWRSLLLMLSLSLVVPMVVASRHKYEALGCMSPALRTYNNRVLAAGGIYMVTFIAAVRMHDNVEPGSAVMWLLALAPAVPVLGMLWAMIRYVSEEADEYLRHRAIMAALFGLALVLGLGTIWGFLETFKLVPHVWSWWVFPTWAIGLALGQFRFKVRGS